MAIDIFISFFVFLKHDANNFRVDSSVGQLFYLIFVMVSDVGWTADLFTSDDLDLFWEIKHS